MTDVHLSSGSHLTPEAGMCLMEYVAWKHGLGFSDRPSCTERVIATIAQQINDRLPDDERQRLAGLVDRLFAAAPVRDPAVRRRVLIRLACWSARSVLDLLSDEDREKREQAIATVGAYLRGEASDEDCHDAACTVAGVANTACTAYAAERDPVMWLDDLLVQYDKAKAEEGAQIDLSGVTAP